MITCYNEGWQNRTTARGGCDDEISALGAKRTSLTFFGGGLEITARLYEQCAARTPADRSFGHYWQPIEIASKTQIHYTFAR